MLVAMVITIRPGPESLLYRSQINENPRRYHQWPPSLLCTKPPTPDKVDKTPTGRGADEKAG